LAEFNLPVAITREKQGVTKEIKSNREKDRFCDKMSSHMMRRTAITTLLILGMPEHLVRKISGHSTASSSFNRYVHYAQVYIDREIDKVHSKMESY
jgi:integrase